MHRGTAFTTQYKRIALQVYLIFSILLTKLKLNTKQVPSKLELLIQLLFQQQKEEEGICLTCRVILNYFRPKKATIDDYGSKSIATI